MRHDGIFRDSYGDLHFWWIFTFILAVCVALCAALFIGIRQIDHHYSKEACKQYADMVDYPVQWRDLTYWDYDCYVQIDGVWTSKDNVRVVGVAP